MKRVLATLTSLLFATSTHAGEGPSTEYVSLSCPAGDITLRLENNNAFVLTLKHWDNATQRHTKTETIAGAWSYSGGVLSLKGTGQLTYRRDKAALKVGSHSGEIDAFTWVSSSDPTFADGFQLVERVAVDNLFSKATPPK